MDQRVINGHGVQPPWPVDVTAFEEQRVCEVCGAACQADRTLCEWCAQLAVAAFEDL